MQHAAARKRSLQAAPAIIGRRHSPRIAEALEGIAAAVFPAQKIEVAALVGLKDVVEEKFPVAA